MTNTDEKSSRIKPNTKAAKNNLLNYPEKIMSSNNEMSYRYHGKFDANLNVCLDALWQAIFDAKYSVEDRGIEFIPPSELDELERMRKRVEEIKKKAFDHFLNQLGLN